MTNDESIEWGMKTGKGIDRSQGKNSENHVQYNKWFNKYVQWSENNIL